jgi:integrase
LSEEGWEEPTPTTSLIDWANAYLDYCKERYVYKTFDEKKSVFKRFFKEVDADMDVDNLTPGIVSNYLINQKKNRSGVASNKDRKNLLAGWNWGMLFMTPNLPKENPFRIPKMPEIRNPRYVPPEEDFWKVYAVAEGQDKVFLLTLLHLACRRDEAFRMRWDDVNFKDKLVRLWTRKTKTGTFEYKWLPMTKELQQSLAWWKENCPLKRDHVFVCLDKTNFCERYYGKPFTSRQHLMKRLCEKAGVKHFGFHAIRHLTATILYHSGNGLSVMQTVLRHNSPTTTNQYLKSIGLENVRAPLENLVIGGSQHSETKEEVIDFDIFGGQ